MVAVVVVIMLLPLLPFPLLLFLSPARVARAACRMSFDDFTRLFTNVDICHFVNTAFFTTKKSWSEAIWHSQWTVSGRNGGGNYESATFLSNPQVQCLWAGGGVHCGWEGNVRGGRVGRLWSLVRWMVVWRIECVCVFVWGVGGANVCVCVFMCVCVYDEWVGWNVQWG